MWLEWHLLRVTLFSCPKGVIVSGEDCISGMGTDFLGCLNYAHVSKKASFICKKSEWPPRPLKLEMMTNQISSGFEIWWWRSHKSHFLSLSTCYLLLSSQLLWQRFPPQNRCSAIIFQMIENENHAGSYQQQTRPRPLRNKRPPPLLVSFSSPRSPAACKVVNWAEMGGSRCLSLR